MLVDDFGYFEQRADRERRVADECGDRYVKACHSRLADRYEHAVATFRSLPTAWPVDRLE